MIESDVDRVIGTDSPLMLKSVHPLRAAIIMKKKHTTHWSSAEPRMLAYTPLAYP
jgi:hypothetical protein